MVTENDKKERMLKGRRQVRARITDESKNRKGEGLGKARKE